MNYLAFFALILFFGMHVNSILFSQDEKRNLRTVVVNGDRVNAEQLPRSLDYYWDAYMDAFEEAFLNDDENDDDEVHEYSCPVLQQKCDGYECCEMTAGGIVLWTVVCLAAVLGIVISSCAFCTCCPWHDRLCCAERRSVAPSAPESLENAPEKSSPTTGSIEDAIAVPVLEQAVPSKLGQ